MVDLKTTLHLLNSIAKEKKESAKNFFALSLISVIFTFKQCADSEKSSPSAKDIEKELVVFQKLSTKLLEDREFVENFGNYGSRSDDILCLVEAINKINKYLLKFTSFSNFDNDTVFTSNMIKTFEIQHEMAKKNKASLNPLVQKVVKNEICWLFCVNNYPKEVYLTGKELETLFKFLEEILEFKVDNTFKLMFKNFIENVGIYSIEDLDFFMENFTNVALFNSFRSKKNDLLFFKNKEEINSQIKMELELTEKMEREDDEEYNNWLSIGDKIVLYNDGNFEYSLKNKQAINPIADKNSFRIGRDAPEHPDSNIWLHKSETTVSRKQCAIDFNNNGFGIICISTSNPTVFKLLKDYSFPVEEGKCFQLGSKVILRVVGIAKSQSEGTLKLKLSTKTEPSFQIQEPQTNINNQEKGGTRKKRLSNQKTAAEQSMMIEPTKMIESTENKTTLEVKPGELAKISLELVQFFTEYNKKQKLNFTFVVKKNGDSFSIYEEGGNQKEFEKINIGINPNQAIRILDFEDNDLLEEHALISYDLDKKQFNLTKAVKGSECFMWLKSYSQFCEVDNIQSSSRYKLEEGIGIYLEGFLFRVNYIKGEGLEVKK